MQAQNESTEKDVYHLPKHFKKSGKLLLKAASKGEYAYIKSSVGKQIIYDFDRTFWYHLNDISKHLKNIHVAFSKMFSAINSNASTDLIRSIGRLDGAIASLVDTYREVDSYELEEGEFADLEQSGLSLLHETLASLIKYAVEAEGALGKQLVDTERLVNENPENLIAGKHTITINFDSTKSIDKLKPLLEWYKSYKEVFTEVENDPEDEEERVFKARAQAILDGRRQPSTVSDINPVDAGILGFVFGSLPR